MKTQEVLGFQITERDTSRSATYEEAAKWRSAGCMSGLRGSATLNLRPVDELHEQLSRARICFGPSEDSCSVAKAWGPCTATVHGHNISRHGGLSLHTWLQRRPEGARRLIAGAFSGVLCCAVLSEFPNVMCFITELSHCFGVQVCLIMACTSSQKILRVAFLDCHLPHLR